MTPWTTAHQAPRRWDSPSKSTGVGCHRLLRSCWHAALFPLDFLPSAGASDHLSPKAVPRCHRELFSTFYLLWSSVFLALQQRSDPPTPSTRPAAQLLGVGGNWLLSLLRGRGSDEPPAFCSLASPPVHAVPGPVTEAPGARCWPLGPCQEAPRVCRCPLSDFSGSLAPSDGNTAGRQGLKQALEDEGEAPQAPLPAGGRGGE